jgi:hypothetical protein
MPGAQKNPPQGRVNAAITQGLSRCGRQLPRREPPHLLNNACSAQCCARLCAIHQALQAQWVGIFQGIR